MVLLLLQNEKPKCMASYIKIYCLVMSVKRDTGIIACCFLCLATFAGHLTYSSLSFSLSHTHTHTHTHKHGHTHRCSFFLFRRTTINLGSFGHESSQNKEKVFKINRGCWLPFLLKDLWTRPNEWSGSSDCPTLHWSS